MSMLAEKKKREKWCLNPRGKSWSDDKNKFGQRLLEKMGWNSGQGLGANNQGQTEIVKVKMKDDNKGLGFKNSGEEWLKTTNQFNELLDQLGSNEEESDATLSKITSSLEDRSKKSKTRVHYHKFTRGKDLSNYSEKDLASIVGPDLIKSRKNDCTDYSSNQVNKGSSTEYFKNKDKLKNNQVSTLEMSPYEADTIFPSTEEEIQYNMKRSKKRIKLKEYNDCSSEGAYSPCLSGGTGKKNTESSSSNPLDSSILEVPSKKRKKKANSENVCNDGSLNSIDECIENDSCSVLEVPSKKKKKKSNNKSSGHENSLYSIDESIENDSYSITTPDLPLEDVPCKKKESTGLSGGTGIEITESSSSNPLDSSILEVPSKKRKKKANSENVFNDGSLNSIDECIENESGSVLEVPSKKKKKKSNSKSLGHENSLYSIHGSIENDSYSITTSDLPLEDVSCKKKEKKLNMKDLQTSLDTEPLTKVKAKKTKLSSVLVQGENCASISSSVENLEIGNPGSNSYVVEDSKISAKKTLKKKSKNIKKIESFQEIEVTKEEGHSGCGSEQCKELLGNHICSPTINISNNLAHSEKCEIEERLSDSSLAINKCKNEKKLNLHKVNTNHQNSLSEETQISEVYIDPKEHDFKASKAVILYEYSLLKNYLKNLNIEEPPDATLKTINGDNLDRATNRKLRLIFRSKQLKLLLPLNEITEIEQKVTTFSKLVKRRIKMFEALKEIEKKVAHIANDLVKSLNDSNSSIVKEVDSKQILDSSVMETVQSFSEQLKALKIKSTDLTRQESHTKSLENINKRTNVSKKNKNKKQVTDKSQHSGPSQCKIKEKLDTLTEQVNQLLLGKIPMTVSEQDNDRKDNRSLNILQKDRYINNKDNDFSFQSGSIVHSESFKCPLSKVGSAQMFDHQRGKEGFERRGYGIRGTFSFRGRGFNSSRGTYVREYHTGETELPHGRSDYRGRGGRDFSTGKSDYRGRGGRESSRGRGGRESSRGRGGRELTYGRGDYRGQGGRALSCGRGDYRAGGGRESSYGRSDFRGRGGRDFSTGRSDYRGRGGRELRARGRISQNNFDAKQYAEKCKAENKAPELGFKGVDLKMIFGYAASKGDS